MELITQKEYDLMKEKLKPIILGKQKEGFENPEEIFKNALENFSTTLGKEEKNKLKEGFGC